MCWLRDVIVRCTAPASATGHLFCQNPHDMCCEAIVAVGRRETLSRPLPSTSCLPEMRRSRRNCNLYRSKVWIQTIPKLMYAIYSAAPSPLRPPPPPPPWAHTDQDQLFTAFTREPSAWSVLSGCQATESGAEPGARRTVADGRVMGFPCFPTPRQRRRVAASDLLTLPTDGATNCRTGLVTSGTPHSTHGSYRAFPSLATLPGGTWILCRSGQNAWQWGDVKSKWFA